MAPVLPCFLLLLLVPLISTTNTTYDAAVSLAALKDLPSLVYYQFGRNFSDQWKKCIEDGLEKCPWYDSVGEQGPCQKGELYVFNKREVLHTNNSLEPVCQPAPCPDDYRLVIPDNKCYHYRDIHLVVCLRAPSIGMNLFGETFCSCEFHEATLLGSQEKECHTLFTQGPCTRGSLFVPVYDLVNFGKGHCFPPPSAKLINGSLGVVEKFLLQHPGMSLCGDTHVARAFGSGSIFPGLQILRCVTGWALPAFHFPTSDKCVVNDEGECVFSLKKKPVEPHPLYLDES